MIVDAVIATYNREDCIETAINNLLQYRDEFSKIYIVVNGSDDQTIDRLELYKCNDQISIIDLPKNLGAPAGKNIGMRTSNADVIIVIDDDAVFFTDNPVAEVKRQFINEPRLGIIQFKIVNHKTKTIQKNEFPGNDRKTQSDTEFLISSFTGAGHAVRKRMLEEVGYYPDSFFYAHEELDLSFRAIIDNWLVKYTHKVGVYHKKDPKGRLPENKMIGKMVTNRMIISYRYLPLIYRIVSGFLWLAKSTIWSRSLSVPINAFLLYRKEKNDVNRIPVNKKSMAYLKANYGRLWY